MLQDYSIATELDPQWYQAWHTWALANFEVIARLEVSQHGLSSAHFTTYIIPAVEGESQRLMLGRTGLNEQASCGPSRCLPATRCRTRCDCLRFGSRMGTSMASMLRLRTAYTSSISMSGWRSFHR